MMILSRDFVFLHLPKTGGTFVSTVLQAMLTRRGIPFATGRQHATRAEIPEAYRDRLILGCARNPYDLKVSIYRYEWWKTGIDEDARRRAATRFPHFPNLTFEEFVAWWDACAAPAPAAARLNSFAQSMGRESLWFIYFYAREPEAVIRSLTEATLTDMAGADTFRGIRFLRTDRLNADLGACLRDLGYPEEEQATIARTGKIYPPGGARRADESWRRYCAPSVKCVIRERERMLFGLFPEFDV